MVTGQLPNMGPEKFSEMVDAMEQLNDRDLQALLIAAAVLMLGRKKCVIGRSVNDASGMCVAYGIGAAAQALEKLTGAMIVPRSTDGDRS